MTTESGDATVTANAAAAASATTAAATEGKNTETQKKNRIQVSNTKKPLFFYVNLAKKYIQQHNEVELSALGMAITTVVTVAEILKNNGLATEKKVITSTVGMKDETRGRMVQKARIEIVLGKSEKFDSLVTNDTAPATTPDPASDSTTAPAQAPAPAPAPALATAKVQAATAPEQAAATDMVENKK